MKHFVLVCVGHRNLKLFEDLFDVKLVDDVVGAGAGTHGELNNFYISDVEAGGRKPVRG